MLTALLLSQENAGASDFLVNRKRSLRPGSAGQKPGGDPEGLAPLLSMLKCADFNGQGLELPSRGISSPCSSA
jgi:hypothetical protein